MEDMGGLSGRLLGLKGDLPGKPGQMAADYRGAPDPRKAASVFFTRPKKARWADRTIKIVRKADIRLSDR